MKFNQMYEGVRGLPLDSEKLKRLNKDELVSKLCSALNTLKQADETICMQADSILATNAELIKQCSLNRTSDATACNVTVTSSRTFSNVVKQTTTPIVLKCTGDQPRFDATEMKHKVENALRSVNVNSTRVTRQGNLIVNLPDSNNKEKATENLKNIFENQVDIGNLEKIPPKLTIVGLPTEVTQDTLIADICVKDSNIKEMIEHGSKIEILGCWEIKNGKGDVSSKKVAVKVSPNIRNYIMIMNKGYLYVNLSRCRVYDRLMVTQCYHCYGYYHFANHCPNKAKPPTCGRCASPHETKNCQSQEEKCINCTKLNDTPSNHCAYSYKCPVYAHEREMLINKTDYSEAKN